MKKLLVTLVLSLFLHVSVSAGDKEYVLDTTHSHVGFSIKHMMISNVKGDFKSYEADLVFDSKTKIFKKVNAIIDANSIDTGITKRDNHLRSADFFDVANHSSIKFSMIKYVANENGGKMYGTLSIRGVNKDIVLNTTIHGVIKDFDGNERVGFTLEGEINRKDFGLTWNKLLETGGFAVGENVKLIVEIEAIEL